MSVKFVTKLAAIIIIIATSFRSPICSAIIKVHYMTFQMHD